MRVITANVNGIRAAVRRGGADWLLAQKPEVILLQEVRATEAQLADAISGTGLEEYSIALAPAATLGRAGVAVLTTLPMTDVRIGVGHDAETHTGRWIEADLDTSVGKVTVVSAYVHSGEAGTQKQVDKYEFLDVMTDRLKTLRSSPTRQALVAGDFNIGHREVDIKNWKGNVNNSGFLPEERAYLDGWFGEWSDLGRLHGGEGPGPYTWWSWRGKAFDTDAGWRIDYVITTPKLTGRVQQVAIGRAATYAERWSDHAPVIVDFA